MNRASKVALWILGLHFLALFTPIYEVSFFGASIVGNIADLAAGPVFIIVFASLFVWNFIVLRYKREYLKYTQLGTLIAMGLLITILWIGTDSNSVLGVSMTYQVILTALFACLLFLESQTLGAIDKVKQAGDKLLKSLDQKFMKNDTANTSAGTDEYEIID